MNLTRRDLVVALMESCFTDAYLRSDIPSFGWDRLPCIRRWIRCPTSSSSTSCPPRGCTCTCTRFSLLDIPKISLASIYIIDIMDKIIYLIKLRKKKFYLAASLTRQGWQRGVGTSWFCRCSRDVLHSLRPKHEHTVVRQGSFSSERKTFLKRDVLTLSPMAEFPDP